MSRPEYISGKNKPKGTVYSEFTNTIHVKYVGIASTTGDMVCEYVEPLYIEKATDGYGNWDDYHEWRPDPRWKVTGCISCYKITDREPPDQSIIKVDNSKDMLPLYIKWALKLGGTVDEEGYITNEDLGEGGLKLHDTLSRLYENINGKHRLRKFSEHKCEKCKKEWIVFDEKDKIEEQ